MSNIVLAVSLIILVVVSLAGINFFQDSSSRYLNAIDLAGEWYLNNQNENFVYYEYYPFDHEHPDSAHDLREIAAIWAIGAVGNFFNDEASLDLAERGFDYFDDTLMLDSENDFSYVDVGGDIKLGYSAFMILGLLEIDFENRDYILEKLANGILYLQQGDGSFDTFFFSDRSTGQDYYPGEAMVALMSLYEETGDKRYLTAVENAFDYYKDYFSDSPETAFVPWQSRAYAKAYQATRNDDYAEFIFEMNDWLIGQYSPAGSCEQFIFDRGIIAAVHMEGVNQAYMVAILAGDDYHAECYYNFSQQAADYLLTLQIRSVGTEMDIHALGGFLGDVDSDSMRVDRNQHAVMALIDAHNLGIIK